MKTKKLNFTVTSTHPNRHQVCLTDEARNNWGSFNENQCCLCGKKVGKNPKMVHYLTNGNIVSYGEGDIEGSQGMFPVGSECAKKLVIQFAF